MEGNRPRGGARRGRLSRLTAAGAAVALAACSDAGAAPLVHRGEASPVPAGSLSARAVAEAQWEFGLDLLRGVCRSREGGNALLSPASAAAALTLLYPAAVGRTAEDVGALLHLPPWSPDVVAALAEHTRALDGLRHDGDLDDEDAPDALQTSNRLWTAPDLEPEPAYLDDVATALAADVRSLDFAGDPQGATKRINTTVEEDTRGVIDRLFDQPLPSSTVAVLTNALHLKARWAVPFTSTAPAPFAAPTGEVSVDMMAGAWGTGRSAAGWRSVELPYRDGTLTAVAVLPPEGTDPCTVSTGTLSALADAPSAEVDVRLPRMRIEQTHPLLGVLTDLGLPARGDYTGLGRSGLEVSEVVQKTFLEVDERGTEAAAATGIAMAVSAVAPRPQVAFDRPFLFVLTDTATRSPLFVTVVQDPSA